MNKWGRRLRRPAPYFRVLRQLASGASARRPGTVAAAVRWAALWNRVRSYTLMSVPRLKSLYRLTSLLDKEGVPGDIVECGTWRGGSAAMMAAASAASPFNRRLWLFDSFQGLPEAGPMDPQAAHARAGDLRTEPAAVHAAMARMGIPASRYSVTGGWFEDTLPDAPIEQIALLHSDADLYESTCAVLTNLYDRVKPGGVIVMDDYGRKWLGVAAAVDEFLATRSLDVQLTIVEDTACWFRKL